MKLATWNWTAAGTALLLLAGPLRAQPPETMPEPARAGSKNWRQSGPDVNYWSGYQGTEGASGGAKVEGPIVMEGGDFVEHDPTLEGGPAYPFSSGNWWRNGHWYAASDFVVWHRTKPFGQVLGFDNSFGPPPDNPLIPFSIPELNKRGASFGVEPGNRTTLGYMLMRDLDNRDHSVEATYLGFHEWTTQDGLISLSPRQLRTQLDFAAPGFSFADSYGTFHESQFHSLELNYRIRNRPGRDRMIMGPDGHWSRQLVPGPTQSLIVGLRGLTIDERWQWLSGRNGVAPEAFSGDMLINTDNNLLGVQIGGDFIGVHESWYWGVRGTAGVYSNFAEGSYHLAGIDSQADNEFIDSQAHAQAAAFFGELSFMAGLNLTDNLVLRASWDLALAGGLVLAPDQVSFDTYLAANVPSLNEGGQIFYTGLSVGLEAYW